MIPKYVTLNYVVINNIIELNDYNDYYGLFGLELMEDRFDMLDKIIDLDKFLGFMLTYPQCVNKLYYELPPNE